ncbi:MAG: magnesium transporter CorA family protein [Planctomycetota bacterium]|jgi:magnesium transporter|nr:magnesium transporter CorA family protein [Planctomycetota bacterium]
MHRSYQVERGVLTETMGEDYTVQVYVSPNEDERHFLISEMDIDEHTLHSALDPDELSRLEFEPEHMAVIFKRPCNQTLVEGSDAHLEFKVASVGVFVYQDRLLAIQSEDMPVYPGQKPVNRELSLREVLLRMLYRTISHFVEHLRAINMMVDAIEKEINRSFENRHLISLFALEKSLVYYLNAINANESLLMKMRNNASKIGFTPDELEMLDDITIENNQCARQAQIYTNILAGMMDARVSIVSNNLNVLMKTLTMITICLQVPTMVVSIFSMNVRLPISYENPLSFWFVMSLAVLALASFTLLWRWRRW